ncbi:hypothetical protein Cgig2_003543 [Carnegiea gigantea]|uniref:Uncharacterized protein n=1 Tax=Carnegiea gigantea TaxID=171969 RepID=A0A9Q1JTZ9_9CARY|nr:hypothetical protein Cgig2_003543 [Carnegiea gigantea]
MKFGIRVLRSSAHYMLDEMPDSVSLALYKITLVWTAGAQHTLTQQLKQVPEILPIELTISKRGSIEREVAQKVFKSKSRDSIVGYGGGIKAKDIRGPSRTRVELEVELNATREKNEVLVDCVTTVETENENLRNRVESLEAEMGKFKDLVSKQLNIHHEDVGSSFQALVLFHYLVTRCKIISFPPCF